MIRSKVENAGRLVLMKQTVAGKGQVSGAILRTPWR
jgi:hypothetical protein